MLVSEERHARYFHLVEDRGQIGRELYRMDVEGACGGLWTNLRLARVGRGREYGRFACDAARASRQKLRSGGGPEAGHGTMV